MATATITLEDNGGDDVRVNAKFGEDGFDESSPSHRAAAIMIEALQDRGELLDAPIVRRAGVSEDDGEPA